MGRYLEECPGGMCCCCSGPGPGGQAGPGSHTWPQHCVNKAPFPPNTVLIWALATYAHLIDIYFGIRHQFPIQTEMAGNHGLMLKSWLARPRNPDGCVMNKGHVCGTDSQHIGRLSVTPGNSTNH